MDLATLQAWLPTGIAAGALALVWGDMRNTKRQLCDRMEALGESVKKALYSDDGQTIYMPRNGCEREQSRCQVITCGKIEALSVKLDLMDAKREHAKDVQQAQMGDLKQALAELTGRVESLTDSVVLRSR